MEHLETMLARLPRIVPDERLSARILAAVHEVRERQRIFRESLFGALAALSALSLVPAVMYAAEGFSNSAFASYFSLLFTDTGTALANWQSIALSLVESAPLFGMTLIVAAVFASLAFLKAAGPYVKPHRGLRYGTS